MKLDILAFAAHPDDVELSCSGSIAKHINNGKKVGIVDLTRGELGSRGTAEIRDQESADAGRILELSVRENLQMADGFFEISDKSLIKIISRIRKFQPDIVLCNAITDRHPDHGRGGDLVSRACFLSGLRRIDTGQEHWRPRMVLRYIQDRWVKPDLVIDISDYFEVKMQSILAYKSQFFDPNSSEPETPISSAEFMEFVEARARSFGREIGCKFGEGYSVERPIGIHDLSALL